MAFPKPRSRFLPTLTEVVQPGNSTFGAVHASTVDLPPTIDHNSRTLFALQQELSHALQAQLHAMLEAQMQQLREQLHECIDAAVQEAVAKAIVAQIAAADGSAS